MAFELPDHLPRGGIPRDKATQILNKVGQTSFQEFNANLVASWVDELDDAIKETKVCFMYFGFYLGVLQFHRAL